MELEIIAFIASALSVSGCIPQIIKILKTQDTQAISYGKYYMAATGGLLWVGYGLMAPLSSIVFWNTISTIAALTVITLKVVNETSLSTILINTQWKRTRFVQARTSIMGLATAINITFAGLI